MARRPLSPTIVAAQRLGKLASAGTSPARVQRDARAILAEWGTQHDAETLREMTSELHADLATGLVAAEEQLDDADESEPGAVKHITAVVAALRAATEALAEG